MAARNTVPWLAALVAVLLVGVVALVAIAVGGAALGVGAYFTAVERPTRTAPAAIEVEAPVQVEPEPEPDTEKPPPRFEPISAEFPYVPRSAGVDRSGSDEPTEEELLAEELDELLEGFDTDDIGEVRVPEEDDKKKRRKRDR